MPRQERTSNEAKPSNDTVETQPVAKSMLDEKKSHLQHLPASPALGAAEPALGAADSDHLLTNDALTKTPEVKREEVQPPLELNDDFLFVDADDSKNERRPVKPKRQTEAAKEMKAHDEREHLNIVFIGHVDAGKSTISGQIL